MIKMDEYQAQALSTALPAALESEGRRGLVYCALKMNGEAGEIAEKIAKSVFRGDGPLNEADLAKELGDVLWYVAVAAHNIGYSLNVIAQMNADKLADRKERGVLQGSGDDR